MFPKYDVPIGALINEGLQQLNEDMRSCPSAVEVKALLEVSPTPENYKKKNCYFVKTLDIGGWLLQPDYYWAAEIYFNTMLDAVLGFERTHPAFNKGMAYVVLGIAEMENGKFDIGSAHLLKTNEEDKDFEPDFEILEKPMWQRFESPILNYLQEYMIPDDIWRYNADHPQDILLIDGPYLVSLLNDMSADDHLFFDATFRSLLHNREIVTTNPNSYSFGRLYSALRDICLLIESLLRKNQISRGFMQKSDQRMLFSLLQKALKEAPKANGFNIDGADNMIANSLDEFSTAVDQLDKEPNKTPIERYWLRYLILARNFMGHHFDITDDLTLPKDKTFSGQYGLVLQNVILTLLYLKHIGAF